MNTIRKAKRKRREAPRRRRQAQGKPLMTDPEVYVHLATRIPKSLHQRLREHGVRTDTPLFQLVRRALEQMLGTRRK